MSDMQSNDQLYEELQQKLASANASAEAAEVHGVICGVISANCPLPPGWFDELFDQAEEGDLLVNEGKSLVESLYRKTLEQVEGAGMGMQLLMPSDAVAIPGRARALTEWCQGFLYGVGLSGQQATEKLSTEAREAIEDITNFTRMDITALGDAENAEEEEDALMEIIEFLWVAAMLIRESFLDLQQAGDARLAASDYEGGHEYH